MPELPEVENIKLGLVDQVLNKKNSRSKLLRNSKIRP